MGSTLASHEDLVYVRGWSYDQICKIFDTLRRRSLTYTLNKDDFARYIGGRHRESNTIFNDLDTDYDGKVDVFEVLVVLTVWSGTSWEEKQDLLFMFFDMMDKRFLKIDEVMLMGTLVVQTMSKFVKLPSYYTGSEGRSNLEELAQYAFPAGMDRIDAACFREFSDREDLEAFEKLRGFIEDQAAKGQAPSVESRMRLQISTLEKHVQQLFEKLERLQSRLPDFVVVVIEYVTAFGRRKRWDFVMQNLRQLVLNLHQCAETMHTTLADLSTSLKDDEATQGLSSVIEPHRRFQQEQMVVEVEQMRQQSLVDFREATELLRRLVEFTEPHEAKLSSIDQASAMGGITAIREEEHEQMVDMSPPRVVEARLLMKQVHTEMLKEINEGGVFSRDTEGFQQLVDQVAEQGPADGDAAAAQGQAGGPGVPAERGEVRGAAAAAAGHGDHIPMLVVIANFDPPPTHQSQMLPLIIGDHITVIGQDGKGWWYGKKQNGTEGWFPPSYVQTKGAHYSSPGAVP